MGKVLSQKAVSKIVIHFVATLSSTFLCKGGYFVCDFLIALNANETEPGGEVLLARLTET